MWKPLAAVLVAVIPACAGTFLINTEQMLLYQEQDRVTLLLANPLGSMVEEIRLNFPGSVRLEEVYVHAGIMETRQGQRELVLAGALWRQGFVRLSWRPALILPSAITVRSATEEWTFEVPSAFVHGEPELIRLPKGILVGRSEGVGQTLRIRFAQKVTITSVLGLGCTPTWEASESEILVHGPFPPGSMVWVSWNHPEVEVKEAVWNDRPVSSAPSGPWEVVDLGDGRFRFSTTASLDTQVLWDLGDGTITTQRDFEYVYSHDGKYLVTLVLADTKGYRRVRQTWVTVARPAPLSMPSWASVLTPQADPAGPYGPIDFFIEVENGETLWCAMVWFDASASQAPPGSTIVRYEWKFENGETIVTDSPYLAHKFKFTWENLPPIVRGNVRKLDVTLTVVDDKGRTSTATTYVLFFWVE